MGRRNQHSKDEQHAMAVEAADALLRDGGLSALTMRGVAQAMGYTVGQLYLLFDNQDHLLLAVNERTGLALYAELRAAIADSKLPAHQQPHTLAARYITFAMAHPHRWRLMFEHRLPEDHPRRAGAEQRVQALFAITEASLRAALAVTPAVGWHAAATLLWSSVHGLCSLVVTGKLRWSGEQDYRPVSDQLVDTLLAGLAAVGAHEDVAVDVADA